MKINSNKIKSLVLLSLVGSNLAKEEKTDNQTELTLNSLPQITTNFTKRGNETDPTLVFAGMSIFFEQGLRPGYNQTSCMNGFPLVPTGSNEDCVLGSGPAFLTSARCCRDNTDCGTWKVFLMTGNNSLIGTVSETSFQTPTGTDYAFVDASVSGNRLIPYVMGEHDLIPII